MTEKLIEQEDLADIADSSAAGKNASDLCVVSDYGCFAARVPCSYTVEDLCRETGAVEAKMVLFDTVNQQDSVRSGPIRHNQVYTLLGGDREMIDDFRDKYTLLRK